MACAFLLGFFSGRSNGYEAAMSNNVVQLARLPIERSEPRPEDEEQLVSDVYARLNRPPEAPAGQQQKPVQEAAEPLAPIQDGEAAPILAELEALEPSFPSEPTNAAVKQTVEAGRTSAASPGSGTLGSLLPPAEQRRLSAPARLVKEAEAAGSQPVVKTPTPVPAAPAKVAGLSASVAASQYGTIQSAPAAKPTPVVTPRRDSDAGFIRQIVPQGWFAQLAAPRHLKDADALARTLKHSGFPVVIERARVRGQEYFRVLVGPEGSRAQAERLVGQLRRESYVKNDPFIRKVN